jgi:Protein of unknown function (DUF1642).|nr:MAG TPA: Protein of unknown function (DUF1642) [Caudoviricetes sp.]
MEYNKKEELFDKINGLKILGATLQESWFNKGVIESFERTERFFNRELVPEVPQYVADWYKSNKKNLDYNLWNYIMDWEDTEEDNFKRWLNNSKDAFQTIINMHQFGYKIKEEKKYKVKFKNVVKDSSCLKYDGVVGKWYFGMGNDSIAIRLYHTKEELEEAGFGEVFNSPLFEVKEVEE